MTLDGQLDCIAWIVKDAASGPRLGQGLWVLCVLCVEDMAITARQQQLQSQSQSIYFPSNDKSG